MLKACQAGTVNDALLVEVEKTLWTSDVKHLWEEIPKALAQSIEGIERVNRSVHMQQFNIAGAEKFDESPQIILTAAIEARKTTYENRKNLIC